MKTVDEIIKWLKEHKCFDSFRCYVLASKSNTGYDTITSYITLNNNILLISNAFRWVHTIEGKAYWADKDLEFKSWYGSAPKFLFKPYDKVLTRNARTSAWKINLFSNWKYENVGWTARCLVGNYSESNIIPFDENKLGVVENESKD